MAENEDAAATVKEKAKSTIKVSPGIAGAAVPKPAVTPADMAKRTIKIAAPGKKGMIPDLPPIQPIKPLGTVSAVKPIAPEATQQVTPPVVKPVIKPLGTVSAVKPIAPEATQHVTPPAVKPVIKPLGNVSAAKPIAPEATQQVTPPAVKPVIKPLGTVSAAKPIAPEATQQVTPPAVKPVIKPLGNVSAAPAVGAPEKSIAATVLKKPGQPIVSAPTIALKTKAGTDNNVVGAKAGSNPNLAVNPAGTTSTAPTIKLKAPDPVPETQPEQEKPKTGHTLNLNPESAGEPKAAPEKEHTGSTLNLKPGLAARAAAPTITLQGKPAAEQEKAADAPKKPGLSIKLGKPAAEKDGGKTAGSSPHKTISLKIPGSASQEKTPAEDTQAEGTQTEETAVDKTSAEPGIFYLIASIVALLMIIFSAYIMIAQFGSYWTDKLKVPVPGLKMTVFQAPPAAAPAAPAATPAAAPKKK